jgi:hypothetical protein
MLAQGSGLVEDQNDSIGQHENSASQGGAGAFISFFEGLGERCRPLTFDLSPF